MIFMRMDRYDEEKREGTREEMPILSREKKNQEMYEGLYLNTKIVDINNIISDEEKKDNMPDEENNHEEEVYEEKNYSISDYLKKAHEKLVDDNAMRDLNNQEFKAQEDEIAKLIASIDEKIEDDDLFKDLRGDNEDTMIGGSLKTDEFDTSIYETLKADAQLENETILDKALSDNTVINLEKETNDKIDHTFEQIIENDHKMLKKKKKLPVIVFSITLFMLIMVIIIIILFH